MKKVTLAIAMAALVLFAGCKKDVETSGTKLKASIEQYSGNDKTYISPVGDMGKIFWTLGDRIRVSNGTADATFVLEEGGEGTDDGDFISENGVFNYGSNNIAVYPETATISGNTVTVTLPEVQAYEASKNGANPMLATFTNPRNVMFKSLCGALNVSLSVDGDDQHITAIELISKKTDDKLNGTFTANATAAHPVLVYSEGASANPNKVRMTCDLTLTNTAQSFYIALPVGVLSQGFTLKLYNGTEEVSVIETTKNISIVLNQINKMSPLAINNSNILNLSSSGPGSSIVTDGMTITGTLSANNWVTIADGATVTLEDVTIDATSISGFGYPGITLEGSATIILKGTNNLTGANSTPAIYVPVSGTLTISNESTGELIAVGGANAAGLVGGFATDCGSIIINGGTITATGGENAAGIGSGYKAFSGSASCGNITINGGTVTATGGENAAGIGSGYGTDCGDITISDAVTSVSATKGANGNYSIGRGYFGSCGTVTIGGTDHGAGVVPNQPDGLTYIYSNIPAATVLVTGITLNKTETTLTVGETETLSVASVLPATATDPTVTWSSNNTGVATVVATTGEVTAVAAGTATITATANDGSNVTATCAVTVNAPAPTVPTGAINGLFKVSATQQVYFSKGNLQYIGSASTPYWKFADNQWDYFGKTTGQNSTDQNVDRDLFGWGTWTGSNPNPTNTSTTNSDYSWDNSDFIQTLSNGSGTWRTLSLDEWMYLVNTRASGATVTTTSGTTNDARYTQATINTDGTGVNGIILFPDGVTIASGEATSWGNINSPSTWTEATKCTAAQWTDLANKGCVFLPAAGYRSNTNVNSLDTFGWYWSSTYYYTSTNEKQAWQLYFFSNYVQPQYGEPRRYGRSVRLVQDN